MDYTSDQIANTRFRPPMSPHSAGEKMIAKCMAALDDQHALNNIIGLVELPNNCIPTGISGYSDDLDAGAGALRVSIGILNAAGDDLVAGSLLLTTSDLFASASKFEDDTPDCAHKAATWKATAGFGEHDKIIVAAKITTAASTAAAGNIYANVDYREAIDGA